MVIQSTLPSSIESALSFVSDHRTQDLLCNWMPGGENWQKCSKREECPRDDCTDPISTGSHDLNHSRICSKFSTASNMCVPAVPNLVYRRRKSQKNSSNISLNSKGSGDRLSNMSSEEAPSLAANKDLCSQNTSINVQHRLHKLDDVPCTKMKKTRGLEVVSKSESINGYLGGEEKGFDKALNNISKSALESYSVNDSCSSSKSNMEHGSASLKRDLDDTAECSSSEILTAELLNGNLSEKEICISILRRHGLLEGVLPTRGCASIDVVGVNGDHNQSQPCKICGHSEHPLKMLICDNCEEAVHVSCCNPRMKKIPVDEWYCQPCSRKKRKLSQQTTTEKSFNVKSEVPSKCRNKVSKGGSVSISFMLKDSEPYTTGVRIGKAFQAEVPDWSGPISNDFDCFGEPLEMDPIQCGSLHEWNNKKSSTLKSVGNWLQCREVLDENTGDGAEGTICGKWRRAPLFEVQTDDWDCSCSVLWDPIHSDCAVPQELETDQVLMHLKYIELLRPRLAAKKRKLSKSKNDTKEIKSVASKHGHDPQEDLCKCV